MSAMPAVALICGSEPAGAPHRRARTGRPASAPRDRRPAMPRTAPGRPAAADQARPGGGRRRSAALLVTVVSLLASGAAQATNHAPSPGAARQNLVQVVVRPGQSLWSVAESADPDQDTRAVIQQIVDLNALSGDIVFAGQQLWVPRG